VPERRNNVRARSAGKNSIVATVVGLFAAIGWRLWTKAVRRPVDSLAVLGAAALSVVIVVNAVFLQSGSHPAPFFANPTPPPRSTVAVAPPPKSVEAPPSAARPPASTRALQTVSVRRNDLIGELIGSFVGSPSRVMAVQRVLSEFGYGQIKPSGVLDEATTAAIEKFERDHQMPVTGRLSDRLVSALSAMSGRPLD